MRMDKHRIAELRVAKVAPVPGEVAAVSGRARPLRHRGAVAGQRLLRRRRVRLITARRDRLELLAEQGSSSAQTVIDASKHLPLLIAGAQLGITVCSLGLGALAEPTVAGLLERPFAPLGVPRGGAARRRVRDRAVHRDRAAHRVRRDGAEEPRDRRARTAATWLVPVHFGFCKLVRPLLALLTAVANSVLKAAHVEPKDELETAYTSDELA